MIQLAHHCRRHLDGTPGIVVFSGPALIRRDDSGAGERGGWPEEAG